MCCFCCKKVKMHEINRRKVVTKHFLHMTCILSSNKPAKWKNSYIFDTFAFSSDTVKTYFIYNTALTLLVYM